MLMYIPHPRLAASIPPPKTVLARLMPGLYRLLGCHLAHWFPPATARLSWCLRRSAASARNACGTTIIS